MNNGFVVHLGGGLYLDEAGKVSTGPQTPSTQVYKGGLKLDTEKVSKALKDIAEFLKDEKTQEKIQKLGMSPKMLSVVLKAAEVGAIAATYFSIYFAVIGVILTLMDVLMHEDGLSAEMKAAMAQISDEIKATDDRLISESVLTIRDAFVTATTNIQTHLQSMVVQGLSGVDRIPLYLEMQSETKPLKDAVTKLIRQDWSPLYQVDRYKEIVRISPWLFTRDANGANIPLSVEPIIRRFDYRMGVTMYAFASSVYPVLIAAGLPWYRSSGLHANILRDIANGIDAFVARMYSECFAKTVHTGQTLFSTEGIIPTFVPQSLPGTSIAFGADPFRRNTPYQDEYLVGAVDLVQHSDAWFANEFFNQLGNPGYDTGRRGAFDYSWPRDGRQRLFPDDAAAKEANEQSSQDLANLHVAAGTFHLMTAAARLRYLSTPPLVSETIKGSASGARRFVSSSDAKAKSPWIFPTGVIEMPATIQQFEARAQARIQTQPPGFPFSFKYRVRLVCIDNSRQDSWANREYIDNIWKGTYVAAGDPRDQRLEVTIDKNQILSDHLIYEGYSPKDEIDDGREISLEASTFDWYVPELGFLYPKDALERGSSASSASAKQNSGSGTQSYIGRLGGTSIHVLKENRIRDYRGGNNISMPAELYDQQLYTDNILGNSVSDLFPDFSQDRLLSLEGAERRWVRKETVKLTYQIQWKSGQLLVRVNGNPKDRPFQIYVVVEEDVYSGEMASADVEDILNQKELVVPLHTAFPLEVVNQLYIVPREFFEAEHDAFAFGHKLWNDLDRRFAKSREIGPRPPSPVEFQRKLDEIIGDSQSTISLAEKQNRQFAFVRENVPNALETVLSDNGIAHPDLKMLDSYS